MTELIYFYRVSINYIREAVILFESSLLEAPDETGNDKLNPLVRCY